MEAILKEEKTTFPTFDEFLKKVNNHSPKSRENIILDLLKTMKHYEKKYQMTTEEFLPRFNKGEFEMDDNYLDYELAHWQGSYEAYQRLSEAEK